MKTVLVLKRILQRCETLKASFVVLDTMVVSEALKLENQRIQGEITVPTRLFDLVRNILCIGFDIALADVYVLVMVNSFFIYKSKAC